MRPTCRKRCRRRRRPPPRDSYLPDALQFKEEAKPDPAARIFRIKVVLLVVIGAMAGLMALRMFLGGTNP